MTEKYNPIDYPIKITCKAADIIDIDSLFKFQGGLKKLSFQNKNKLMISICKNGFTAPFFVWLSKDIFNLMDGTQRLETLLYMRELGWEIPELPIVYIEADNAKDAKAKLLAITSQYGEFDEDILKDWFLELDDEISESIRLVDQELDLIYSDENETRDPDNTTGDDDLIINAERLTSFGDLWELGDHRLYCGNSCDPEDVEAVMIDKKAELVFTDPPYGMKKEKDGVLNDNLNFEDLLNFNKEWIDLAFKNLKPIGSFYCWGTDEPLMDIYTQILKPMIKAEKLTFRNLITWKKGSAQGRTSAEFRMYPIEDEKCLFVMAGVQGFNNNSNHYFNGFEPVREYLEDQFDDAGWSMKFVADHFGFHPRMVSHWKDKSQFSLIKYDQYKELQVLSNELHFQKPYTAILEAYKTAEEEYINSRAYFDNTHESMSNVWEFPTTNGLEKDDAGGHATPKPIALCSRAIISSSRVNDLILDLFLGSGSTIIAAEKTGRRCYGLELDPGNCDIIVLRFQKWCERNGKTPIIKRNGEIWNG